MARIKHPDLIGRELAGIAAGQRFELFGHRGVLIGRGLQPKRGFAPGRGEQAVVSSLLTSSLMFARSKQSRATSRVPASGWRR